MSLIHQQVVKEMNEGNQVTEHCHVMLPVDFFSQFLLQQHFHNIKQIGEGHIRVKSCTEAAFFKNAAVNQMSPLVLKPAHLTGETGFSTNWLIWLTAAFLKKRPREVICNHEAFLVKP